MTLALILLSACLPQLEVADDDLSCVAFLDADGDGFGSLTEWIGSCDAIPVDHVEDSSDCDDSDVSIHPDADELCNSIDDDCDGLVDEDGDLAWYGDDDGDGYGAGEPTWSCEDPGEGYSDNADDCDDGDAGAYPDAPVDCSALDRNCDGNPDDIDIDGDGYPGCEECDDTDATINPGAAEICDGLDQDCNGDVDDAPIDGNVYYRDLDGDGWGDSDDTAEACDTPVGYSDSAGDCDDTRSDISPDATEICNGLDDDCNGDIDDAAVDAYTWYADTDGDGYGVPDVTTASCTQPSGYSATDDDCDDADTAYNPGASEDDCTDPNDYNCDGATGYVDGDGDGWAACEECDDSDASISPDAEEICDSVDNDCDGDVDEDDAIDASTWYADADTDGYGDALSTTTACSVPSGYSSDSSDCDDTDSTISPSGTELCDDADNDCDGTVDEDDAADASTWYADTDSDGYGNSASTTEACDEPSGYTSDSSDCDDADEDINPDATEICDTLDNDCDGAVDPGTSEDASTWYPDADGDGYGHMSASSDACTQPSGYVSDNSDCDDADADVNPDEDEICDSVDNDCDGDVDEDDAVDASTWYGDGDGDGYGDADDSSAACNAPSGTVPNSDDCDDTDADISPDGEEVCDAADNDCDGAVDEDDATDASTWYADDDGDDYGDATDSDVSCDAPSGYVATAMDCDDSDADVNPDADEYCDSIDNDCDGVTDENDAVDASTWYTDGDGDSYGSGSGLNACDQPSGHVSVDGDCDDADSSVNPDADEYCDSIDNDCDGTVDEDDALDVSTWYEDGDGDGYGAPDVTTEACNLPSGYASTDDDCDDDDSSINPGASEACNGDDDDCDGSTDEDFLDTDSDGTADCVDDCPVYADSAETSNGDGSSSSPYMSIGDAITLRGTYCDQIILLAGTYSEQVDYGGEDLDISSDAGADKTIIDGSASSGSVVTFADGESSNAVLEGVTIRNGNGTTGDGSTLGGGYTLGTSQRHGGGVYIYEASPTITDCIVTDNDVTGFGAGILAYSYDGTISGTTIEDNVAGATNYSGGGILFYDSDATVVESEFSDNEVTGSSGDGAGIMSRYSDLSVTHSWFEGNAADNGHGDAVRFLETDGIFANNVVIGHDNYAVAVSDSSDIDVVNNTIDGNGTGLLIWYNSTGYPSGDVVDNLITNNDYYGIYATYYPCVSIGSISYNDVYNNGSDWVSSYCESYWSGSGNVDKDPKYEDRSKDDFSLKKDSPIKDSGTDTSSYGVTDDYDGDTRSSGSYSMGAYERD